MLFWFKQMLLHTLIPILVEIQLYLTIWMTSTVEEQSPIFLIVSIANSYRALPVDQIWMMLEFVVPLEVNSSVTNTEQYIMSTISLQASAQQVM